jgi:hypothetical protein
LFDEHHHRIAVFGGVPDMSSEDEEGESEGKLSKFHERFTSCVRQRENRKKNFARVDCVGISLKKQKLLYGKDIKRRELSFGENICENSQENAR